MHRIIIVTLNCLNFAATVIRRLYCCQNLSRTL